MKKDSPKIPVAEIKKIADFLFFWIMNTIAKPRITNASPISTQRTNRETPKLDHLELAVRIN